MHYLCTSCALINHSACSPYTTIICRCTLINQTPSTSISRVTTTLIFFTPNDFADATATDCIPKKHCFTDHQRISHTTKDHIHNSCLGQVNIRVHSIRSTLQVSTFPLKINQIVSTVADKFDKLYT